MATAVPSADSIGSSSNSRAAAAVAIVTVVVRALYVFDDPLFWLPRNRRSKKILQNAELRKGANLKKVAKFGVRTFRVFFLQNHDGKTQNHCPAQCFGLRVRFSKHASQTQSHMAAKQKALQNTTFLQQRNFAKNTFLKSELLGIGEMLFGLRLHEEKQVKCGFCNLC